MINGMKERKTMKNPIVQGWYADPEPVVYNDKVYIYVTKSLPFEEQLNIDLVVSEDLENYEVIQNVLDMSTFPSATFAVWAPSIVEKKGKYYLIFAANDIQSNEEDGGLYIGVSDKPEGPFQNIYEDGRPFINRFYNGAQPIDAHFYKEGNDVYLYYGGWDHLNVCKMNEEMNGLVPVKMGSEELIAEITPEDYHEAPCVLKVNDKYILMYSLGGWTNGTYRVKTAVSDSPLGPFAYQNTVLEASEIADGPGHNGVFQMNGKNYIAYHRRFVGDMDAHHRVLCIDKMVIDGNTIKPIVMT